MVASDTNNLSRMDGWDQGSALACPLLWVSHSGDANLTSHRHHQRACGCKLLAWLVGSPRAGMGLRSLVIQFNKTTRYISKSGRGNKGLESTHKHNKTTVRKQTTAKTLLMPASRAHGHELLQRKASSRNSASSPADICSLDTSINVNCFAPCQQPCPC